MCGATVERYRVGFLGLWGTMIPMRTCQWAFLQYACPCALVGEPSRFLVFFGGGERYRVGPAAIPCRWCVEECAVGCGDLIGDARGPGRLVYVCVCVCCVCVRVALWFRVTVLV